MGRRPSVLSGLAVVGLIAILVVASLAEGGWPRVEKSAIGFVVVGVGLLIGAVWARRRRSG